jgi:hypothetical protein
MSNRNREKKKILLFVPFPDLLNAILCLAAFPRFDVWLSYNSSSYLP